MDEPHVIDAQLLVVAVGSHEQLELGVPLDLEVHIRTILTTIPRTRITNTF